MILSAAIAQLLEGEYTKPVSATGEEFYRVSGFVTAVLVQILREMHS